MPNNTKRRFALIDVLSIVGHIGLTDCGADNPALKHLLSNYPHCHTFGVGSAGLFSILAERCAPYLLEEFSDLKKVDFTRVVEAKAAFIPILYETDEEKKRAANKKHASFIMQWVEAQAQIVRYSFPLRPFPPEISRKIVEGAFALSVQ